MNTHILIQAGWIVFAFFVLMVVFAWVSIHMTGKWCIERIVLDALEARGGPLSTREIHEYVSRRCVGLSDEKLRKVLDNLLYNQQVSYHQPSYGDAGWFLCNPEGADEGEGI